MSGCSSQDPGAVGTYTGRTPSGIPSSTGTGTPSMTPTTTTTTPTGTSTGTTPPSTPMTGNETWADGKMIAASITIMPSATVTIAPGATVTLAAGVSITVGGTLTGTSAAAAHGKLTGTAWGGLVVASGGTLSLTDVDLTNAQAALHIASGAAAATYIGGTISGATQPFLVDAGGKLKTDHANVTLTKGSSSIGGEIDATYLNYDANGSEGIYSTGAAAVLSFDDSTFFGPGPNASDMISLSGAASLHIAYSEIHGAHCAFHFNSVASFDISNMSIHDNSFGFMLYGSGSTGTRTIASSNIYSNADYGADEGSAATMNGLITIENGYWSMNGPSPGADANNVRQFTNAITVTNMSMTTMVGGTGPRPTTASP